MSKTIEHTLTINRITLPSGDVFAEAVCTCGDRFGDHWAGGSTDTELLVMIDDDWDGEVAKHLRGSDD